MFSFNKQIRSLFVFLVVFVLALFLFPEMQQHPIRFITQPFVLLITEIQKGFLATGKGIGGIWTGYVDLRAVREDNQELESRIDRLISENIRLQEFALANQRLQEILGLKQTRHFSFTPANVIGRDPTNWYKTIQIDKGSNDGIKVDMGVSTLKGVVGLVIETTPRFSKVLLLTDRNSALAGLIQRSRDEGVVQGTEKGGARIKYISLLSKAGEGDLVVSSGLAGSFPKGLLIGYVGSFIKKETDLFQEAEVIPAVDFSHLEEVLVITSNFEKGGEE